MKTFKRSWGKRALSVVIMVLTGCATSPPSSDPVDVVGQRKVIALVPDEQTGAEVRAAANSEGYRRLDTTRLPGLDLTMLSFEMPAGITGAQAIAALEGAAPASTVGINHAYRVQQGVETVAALDYANAMMGWPVGGCPARAPIGVIDTGIDTAAPALAGSRIVTRAFFDGAPAPATHGTQVASVLSAKAA